MQSGENDGKRLADAAGLLKAGKAEEAASIYEEMLAREPGHARALAGLSRTWTARDDFHKGLDLAWRALKRLTRRRAEAEARLALGEAHFRAGNLEEAGIAFRRALAADPEMAPAWYGLARYALTVPRYQEAGRLLRRADALDPEDPRTVRRLASLVASREETIELYRRYLDLPPAEGEQAYANARAWLAVLEAAGKRKLYRLEGPEQATGLRLGRVQGLPLVDVRVGDLPVRPFLLDSGAGGVTISADLARRLHLDPVGDFTVRGVSSETRVQPFVLLPGLSVGPYTFHNVPAVITAGRSELRGIVGLSLLAPLRPVLEDFQTLSLQRIDEPHAGCPANGWWRVRNIGGMLRITARLEQQPVHLVLDTGAARSILSRAALQRIGLPESTGGSSTGIRGLTGDARRVGRVRDRASLTFFRRQVSVRGMPVLDLRALSHSVGSEVDGILGVDLLKGLRFTFDYAAGRLRVEPRRRASR